MTAESGNGESHAAQDTGNPDVGALLNALNNDGGQALLRALGNDRNAAAAVRNLLTKVDLAPEQEAVVALLLSAQHNGEDALADPREEEAEVALPTEGRAASHAAPGERRLRRMRRELDALRQVNDTLAAALGACAYCWGGDEDCEACDGRGHPGSTAPDEQLFEELVLPAVRRVRAGLRHGRPGMARRRY